MGKDLNELASYMLPLVQQLLAECQAVCDTESTTCEIVDTGRTPAEQVQKLAAGVSWTSHSKHEPQPPEGKSEAIDIAPRSYMLMKGWNPSGPLWSTFGEIGERVGLHWGGRFPRPDPGHFQYVHPSAQVLTDPDLSTQM
jgi:D-alanyl-D-alanine carboxypeptidase-like protein